VMKFSLSWRHFSSKRCNDLAIIFEDNHLLVVNKPPGLLSQPNQSSPNTDNAKGCIYDMIKDTLAQRKGKQSADGVYLGLVHRLDRVASGVLVTAKTSKAANRLSEAIRERMFQKFYITIVHGEVKHAGECKDLLEVQTDSTSKIQSASLSYVPLHTFTLTTNKTSNDKDISAPKQPLRTFSILKVNLETGRKHQIRAQLASLGHPIVGDLRYCPPTILPSEVDKVCWNNHMIALHAGCVEFLHPVKKEKMSLIAKIPKAWQSLVFPTVAIDQIVSEAFKSIEI